MNIPKNERFNEDIYQHHLESLLHGRHVDYGFYGISDITTDKFHAEIKAWNSWKHVIGQLTSYNHASPRDELRAYMYGKLPSEQKVQSVKSLLSKFNISLFHIELCEEVLTITNCNDMSTCEHLVNIYECDKETIDIDKMKQEIKLVYDQSLVCENKICINIEIVVKLLGAYKNRLLGTLRLSYKENIDYICRNDVKNPNPTSPKARKYCYCLITLDCFKRLAMRSNARNADLVRTCFVETDFVATNLPRLMKTADNE